MVNNSININKTSDHLSPQFIENKKKKTFYNKHQQLYLWENVPLFTLT